MATPLSDLVQTSDAVAATSSRLAKVSLLSELIRSVSRDEVGIALGFLAGTPRQGKLGVGGARVSALRVPPASQPSLTLGDVDASFGELAAIQGARSSARRQDVLTTLFARATDREQWFLVRLLVGELRQGALEGVLYDAVAQAAGLPAAAVRRAAMLAGDLGRIGHVALTDGAAGLAAFQIEWFRPVDPMLADTAASVDEALERLGTGAFEWKLDGARIQVHKAAGDVRVFTRNLRDVTPAVPEVVRLLSGWPADRIILDGEVIALRADGSPLPFQTTMRRFGRKLDVHLLEQELPLTAFFFDCLASGDRVLIDEPYATRVEALRSVVPAEARVPALVTGEASSAQEFLDDALRRGHEGVMAKALDAPYAAGRRGQAWLKIKQARTLDLVVLAAEWGHGRRRGWLSNLHLGARDPQAGFVMLGKTFKGLTDEMLAWQTERLLALEERRDAYTVYVRPELVVEIAFNDVQLSPQYPGRLALRFARVRGYRPDKNASDADTLEAVQEIYATQTGELPPVPKAGEGR